MKLLKSIFKGLFADEFASFQKQIQSAQKALIEKETTISQLVQTKRILVSNIDSFNQDIMDLRNQVDILQGTISDKDGEIRLKTQKIADLEKAQSEKQSESNILRELIRVHEDRIESLKSSLNEANQHSECLQNLIEKKDYQLQELTDRSEKDKKQIDNLSSLLSTQKNKIQELTRELSVSKDLISKAEQENIEKSNRILTKETELVELKECKKSLEEEVYRLTESLKKSRDQRALLTSKNKDLEAEKQELMSKLNKLQNESTDEALLTALKNDVKQKQETISGLESNIQDLNEELSIIRNQKKEANRLLSEKVQECESLEKELQSISARYEAIKNIERALAEAKSRIDELETTLKNAPTLDDLIRKDKRIESLESMLQEYKTRIADLEPKEPATQKPDSIQGGLSTDGPSDTTDNQDSGIQRARPVYLKPKFPYRKKPVALSKDVVTVDFPPIENDNVYSQTARLIDKVFNHRSNSFLIANDIFLHKPVEEISRMRFDLEEAARTGIPYLTCPCCGNLVKISSRKVGFGSMSREVQFFTHAVNNVPCDLKRDNSHTLTIDEGDKGENDFSYLKELRTLLANSLRTELSLNKGLSNVEDGVFVNSDELPKIMKRRLADVTAKYNDIDLVFELVTPTTNVARVHDRDIFYLLNRRQVFWIFGLESIVDYNELRRSVSKDIFFTNKRNVFVFDLEAQEESKRRGELMLKCNWLDEDGAWYYLREKNGKNGYLISLDQIHFDEDGCRPYFYDADEAFYLKNPTAERSLKLSREKLKEDIIESWNYEQQRKRATEQMYRENGSVEAYYDGKKWGFKFGDTIFIEPIFDSKPIMLGDFAKVEKDGRFGVVNRFGDYRLQPDYNKVELLPNGYILYASKDNWYLFGVIDPVASFASNDEVIVTTISKHTSIYQLIIKKYLYKGQQPEEFYFIDNEIFKKDSNSGKWSLWQSNGEKVTDISWDSFEFKSEDTIKASSNGRTQLLALDGTIIEEQRYKSETKLANGCVIVETFDGLWGLADVNGIEIESPQYDAIIALDEKFLKYQEGSSWGIITTMGEIISEPIYHSIEGFDGENFEVTKLNEIRGWGYLSGKVDKTGNPVSEVISQMEFGFKITQSFEKFGFEKDGNILIPHIYDSLSYWGEDKFIAQKDSKFGIIDSKNKILLDFKYSSITPLKEGRSTIKKGASQHEIDNNLKIVEDIVINLQEGYKKIKLGGKWGILNPQGEIIVDYLYDEITTFRGRLVGIINGRLVKLNAYYPYRLAMNASNLGIIDSRDIVCSGGVKFQNGNKRNNLNLLKDKEISVALINWTVGMKYPMVLPYDKTKHNVRAKHIDKASDFSIGDTFEVKVKSIIIGYGVAKGKKKGVGIALPNGMKSYIYKKDFNTSGIDIATVNIDDCFIVTKLGYDEELDRTQWMVKGE